MHLNRTTGGRCFALSTAALLSALASSPAAHAEFADWDGSTGNWDDDARWSGGVEPTAQLDVSIQTGVVTIDRVGEVSRYFDTGRAESPTDPGTATLNILSGGELTTILDGTISYTRPSTVNVSGLGSAWNINGGFYVGRGGDGTLNIADSGTVLANNANFGATIATGFRDDLSDGRVNVSGVGSVFYTAGRLAVGFGGRGVMMLDDGGAVDSASAAIGSSTTTDGTGAVTVSGAGTQWNNLGELGIQPNGTLLIEGGGLVSNNFGRINGSTAAQARAEVTGADSLWYHASGFEVGGTTNNAVLNITDGGRVFSEGEGSIGYGWNAVGEVTVSGAGSTLDNPGLLSVGRYGRATLNIEEGGSATVGTLRTGRSTTTFMNFVLASTSDPLIDVSGDAYLGGVLGVGFADGVTPIDGQDFTLIDIAGTSSGAFSNASEWALVGQQDGIDLRLSYVGGDGNDVVLYAIATLPGDFDGDGDVDNADTAVFIGNFGMTSGATYTQGDLDGDGDIDNADVAVFIGNFGTGASLTQAQRIDGLEQLAAVPEPGSLAALLVGGLIVLRRRRDEIDRSSAVPPPSF